MSPRDRPSVDRRAALLSAAAQVPSTRPGTWRRRALGGALLAVIWTVAAARLLGARADWRQLPGGALAQTFVILSAVAALASAVGLARGRAMVGAATERLTLVLGGGSVALLALMLAVDPRGPSTVMFSDRITAAHALGCDGLTILIGLPLIALGQGLLRGLTLARPGLTGACVGLGAATWAHVVVRFHCPVGGSMHAILGHLLPALPLMIVGAWAARADWAERLAARAPSGARRADVSGDSP